MGRGPYRKSDVSRERIRAAVSAEARRVADAGLATEDAIALALRLGAGHPRSPFA